MNDTITRRTMAVLAASVAALAFAGTASAQERKLTYATYIPDTYAMVKADKWFMDEVTKRTDGKITWEPYYAGTLLKASDMLPGVAAGAADVGNSVPSAYNRREYPLSNVTLPFITNDPGAVAAAFAELYETNDQFRQEYENQGVKLLYAPAYSENTLWSTKPVDDPSDFQGLKVRAVLAIGDALSKLGASTVAIPWPDALEGLERGVVDAMSAAPFDTAVAGGLPEIANFGSDAGMMGSYAVSATVMNLDTWNSLDPETQAIVEQVAKEAADHYATLIDQEVDAAAAKVAERVKAGEVTINRFSEEDIAKLRDTVGQEIWTDWIETAQAAGADGQAILDRYRELAAKHEEQSDYVPGFDRVESLLK